VVGQRVWVVGQLVCFECELIDSDNCVVFPITIENLSHEGNYVLIKKDKPEQAVDVINLYKELPEEEKKLVVDYLKSDIVDGSSSTYVQLFTALLNQKKIHFKWKPDYEKVEMNFKISSYPPTNISKREIAAMNDTAYFFKNIAKKIGYCALITKLDHNTNDLRFPDLLLVRTSNDNIEKAYSFIEFKKVGVLRPSNKSSDRDHLKNDAVNGIGQVINYCKMLFQYRQIQTIDCAISDFERIMFVRCSQIDHQSIVKISARYTLSNVRNKPSTGVQLLIRMWSFVVKGTLLE